MKASEVKQGMRIYIRSCVGKIWVNGYCGVITRVNKVNGKVHSLRVLVESEITMAHGFSRVSYKRTFRVRVSAYTFYKTNENFRTSMHNSYENVRAVIAVHMGELKYFHENTPGVLGTTTMLKNDWKK